MQKIRAECDSGQGKMRQWSPRIWCLFVLWGTFKYLWLLWSTYWYFEVFFGTSGYFEVLLGILRYFWVLWGTFGYFEVLLGVSEKVFQSLGPDPFCHQQHHHYHHYCVWRSCLSRHCLFLSYLASSSSSGSFSSSGSSSSSSVMIHHYLQPQLSSPLLDFAKFCHSIFQGRLPYNHPVVSQSVVDVTINFASIKPSIKVKTWHNT